MLPIGFPPKRKSGATLEKASTPEAEGVGRVLAVEGVTRLGQEEVVRVRG